MLRVLQQLILTTLFAVFASQANAMFIQPDWFDPTQPGVGTNRYAYSHNDPVNNWDSNGNCTNDACDYDNYTSSWSDERDRLERDLEEVERQISEYDLHRDDYLETIHELQAAIDVARANANISKSHHAQRQIGAVGAVPDRLGQVISKIIPGRQRNSTTPKPVSLPSHKKISIDMDHVQSGHMVGGSRISKNSTKDTFPERMTREQVERAIRDAYRHGKRVQTQGDRVRVQGQGIEMWVNTRTKVIETAYPFK